MVDSERTTRPLRLATAAQTPAEDPQVDEAKVARARDAIERGTYRVDAAAIARRILETR